VVKSLEIDARSKMVSRRIAIRSAGGSSSATRPGGGPTDAYRTASPTAACCTITPSFAASTTAPAYVGQVGWSGVGNR
jgi:hypothetical protein